MLKCYVSQWNLPVDRGTPLAGTFLLAGPKNYSTLDIIFTQLINNLSINYQKKKKWLKTV